MSEGIFSQIREEITKSVQDQEIPPVIDNQVVFPMISKNDVANPDGQSYLAQQYHLGICLKALMGKKIVGMRFQSDDNPELPAIGWVVAIEEDQPLIISSHVTLN